jgi:hypothetical protein
MSREAMKLALDMLNEIADDVYCDQKLEGVITALRQALETEQEPVAWRTFDGEGGYDYRSYEMNETYDKEWSERNPNHKGWVEPLYTAPQKKEWVGLTDEEISYCRYAATFCDELDTAYMAELIEKDLKEKNHG